MVLLESHNSGKELILKGHWGTTEHCQCGLPNGCPDCYGKINCGCSDCYQPETRTFKIKKARTLALRFDKTQHLDPFDPEYVTADISHETSRATLRARAEEVQVEASVVRRHHAGLDYKRRPMSVMETLRVNRQQRLSVPDFQARPVPDTQRRRERRREEFQERPVGPPKQTRYFCKTCNTDVCNACVSTSCSSHIVQFLGSGYFHCKERFQSLRIIAIFQQQSIMNENAKFFSFSFLIGI